MAEDLASAQIGRHGEVRLPSVEVDSYNIELKDVMDFWAIVPTGGLFKPCWTPGGSR